MKSSNLLCGGVVVFFGIAPTVAQCPVPAPYDVSGGECFYAAPIRTAFTLIASGCRVEVVRTPDTAAPSLYADLVLPEELRQVWSLGGFGYALGRASIFRVDRLTTATNPLVLQSSLRAHAGETRRMIGYLDHAYIIGTTGQLHPIDYTDPAAPVEHPGVSTGSETNDMTGLNSRVFVTTDNGITIFDVSNPLVPQIIRNISIPSGCGAIGLIPFAANMARLVVEVQSPHGLIQVIDIDGGAAATPTLRDSIQLSVGNILSIRATDVCTNSRIVRLNISNPDAVTTADMYSGRDGSYHNANLFNGRLFVSASHTGLLILDDATLDPLTSFRSGPTSVNNLVPSPLFSAQGTLFCANSLAGVSAIHVDANAISLLGVTGTNGLVNSVSAAGTRVFANDVGGAVQQVRAFAASNPANLLPLNTYISPDGNMNDVIGIDSRAIVRTSRPGSPFAYDLELVDFAPATPVRLHRVIGDPSPTVGQIVVRAGHAFVLSDNRLLTYRIDPAALTLVSSVTFGTPRLYSITFSGAIAYIAEYQTLLGHVVDTTDPTHPSRVRTFDTRDSSALVTVAGNWLATLGGSAMHFYEISEADRPIYLADTQLPAPPARSAGIFVAGVPTFVLANTWCGVRAYRPPSDFAPVIVRPPQRAFTCPGGSVTYTVDARVSNSPANPTTYQWQHYVNNLAIDIPGALQPSLTLTGVSAEDAEWGYRVVVTNDCGTARSAAGALDLCIADTDCDGVIGSPDFFSFLALFFAGNPAADVNGDHTVNSQDFFLFLNTFFVGC